MKVKTSFPYEIFILDLLVGVVGIAVSIYGLIVREYLLCVIVITFLVFLGTINLLMFIFTRFYITIYDKVEIRKYFKIRQYELEECTFHIEELNETVNGELIYILTIKYYDKVILKINSNSFDSDYRTKEYVNKFKNYNNIIRENPSYKKRMRSFLTSLGELTQTHNGFCQKIQECDWIPFYRFRFSEDTDKEIYKKLKQCLESFNGNLTWTLMYEEEQSQKRLYTIIPSLYAKVNCMSGLRENARGLLVHCDLFEDELYGLDKFNETKILAYRDIPNLIDYINKYFEIIG